MENERTKRIETKSGKMIALKKQKNCHIVFCCDVISFICWENLNKESLLSSICGFLHILFDVIYSRFLQASLTFDIRY